MAWTHASAFGGASVDYFRGAGEEIRTDDVSPGVRLLRLMAAIAMLIVSWLVVVTAYTRRGLYGARDRRALVVVLRHSPTGTLLAQVLIIMLPIAVMFGAFFGIILFALEVRSPSLIYAAMAVLNVAGWVFLGWVLAGAALQMIPAWLSKSAKTSIGDDTPEGDRWVIESLAARNASDGAAAFRLAHRVLIGFPTGRTLAAGARTNALKAGYERLGFEPGKKNRVYLET